jgi:hypothetical protein
VAVVIEGIAVGDVGEAEVEVGGDAQRERTEEEEGKGAGRPAVEGERGHGGSALTLAGEGYEAEHAGGIPAGVAELMLLVG